MAKRKKNPAPEDPPAKVGILRNRVIERRRMLGRDLAANDRNWRGHPDAQKAALKSILTTVGMAGELLAYHSERNGGRLTLVDGHLRSTEFADELWDVAITDLNDKEADLLLAAHDPIAAMAQADEQALQALLAEIDVESAELEALLAEQAGLTKESQGASEADLRQEFSVLVQCEGEDDQRVILEELSRHGLTTRALIVDFPKIEKKEPKPGPPLKNGQIEIVRSSAIERTARVMQLEGMFDIPPSKRREEKWRLQVELDRPWNIGLIVGASGSGKTTVAKELFGSAIVGSWPWTAGRAVIDDFPAAMGIADITSILSSVGFSSPPSWLKPYSALSNGEQFRVNLARTMAESPELAVVDEFTSVVDRTVAKIGSAALAKSIRTYGRKFIAVACHYDIEEWLQPDWKIDMPSGRLTWRSLRRRPEISLQIRRTTSADWEIFRRHHYLDHNLHRSAACFLATVNGTPAAFTGAIHRPHASGGYWSEHRTVCHPDFQGVGIGNAMSEFVASLFVCKGKTYRSVTTHPAMIRHRLRSSLWKCTRKPEIAGTTRSTHGAQSSRSAYRMTASFEYVGPPREAEAKQLGVIE